MGGVQFVWNAGRGGCQGGDKRRFPFLLLCPFALRRFPPNQAALAYLGPVSVTIDASPASFYYYSGGLYEAPDAECSQVRTSATPRSSAIVSSLLFSMPPFVHVVTSARAVAVASAAKAAVCVLGIVTQRVLRSAFVLKLARWCWCWCCCCVCRRASSGPHAQRPHRDARRLRRRRHRRQEPLLDPAQLLERPLG